MRQAERMSLNEENLPDGRRYRNGVITSAGDAASADATRASNAAYDAQVRKQAIPLSRPIGGSAPAWASQGQVKSPQQAANPKATAELWQARQELLDNNGLVPRRVYTQQTMAMATPEQIMGEHAAMKQRIEQARGQAMLGGGGGYGGNPNASDLLYRPPGQAPQGQAPQGTIQINGQPYTPPPALPQGSFMVGGGERGYRVGAPNGETVSGLGEQEARDFIQSRTPAALSPQAPAPQPTGPTAVASPQSAPAPVETDATITSQVGSAIADWKRGIDPRLLTSEMVAAKEQQLRAQFDPPEQREERKLAADMARGDAQSNRMEARAIAKDLSEMGIPIERSDYKTDREFIQAATDKKVAKVGQYRDNATALLDRINGYDDQINELYTKPGGYNDIAASATPTDEQMLKVIKQNGTPIDDAARERLKAATTTDEAFDALVHEDGNGISANLTAALTNLSKTSEAKAKRALAPLDKQISNLQTQQKRDNNQFGQLTSKGYTPWLKGEREGTAAPGAAAPGAAIGTTQPAQSEVPTPAPAAAPAAAPAPAAPAAETAEQSARRRATELGLTLPDAADPAATPQQTGPGWVSRATEGIADGAEASARFAIDNPGSAALAATAAAPLIAGAARATPAALRAAGYFTAGKAQIAAQAAPEIAKGAVKLGAEFGKASLSAGRFAMANPVSASVLAGNELSPRIAGLLSEDARKAIAENYGGSAPNMATLLADTVIANQGDGLTPFTQSQRTAQLASAIQGSPRLSDEKKEAIIGTLRARMAQEKTQEKTQEKALAQEMAWLREIRTGIDRGGYAGRREIAARLGLPSNTGIGQIDAARRRREAEIKKLLGR